MKNLYGNSFPMHQLGVKLVLKEEGMSPAARRRPLPMVISLNLVMARKVKQALKRNRWEGIQESNE